MLWYGVVPRPACLHAYLVMTECDISWEINNDLSSDPNLNYDILHDHITKMKNKHLPFLNLRNFTNTNIRTVNGYPSELSVLFKLEMQCTWSLNDVINNVWNIIHWKISYMYLIVYWKRPFVTRKFNITASYLRHTNVISRKQGRPFRILSANRKKT